MGNLGHWREEKDKVAKSEYDMDCQSEMASMSEKMVLDKSGLPSQQDKCSLMEDEVKGV